jgi:hypothetical protein
MTSLADANFSQSYAEARGKFLALCGRRGLAVTSYRNPAPGPDGTELYTDVARIGPDDAERVLFVESGTHGVEGFAGSGIQCVLLADDQGPRPAPGTALVLVHALNPYGFAWIRRVNENNVDLNRSFVDHAGGNYPANPGYADLADSVVPHEWTDASRAAAEAAYAAYAAKHGDYAAQTAYKRGQHTHPNGLFFGGQARTWAAGTVDAIVAQHTKGARRAALIDLHTGLGPFGYGDCLTPCEPGSPEGRRASAWYGKVRHTLDKTSGYSGSQGTIINGYTDAAPDLEWTCIGLEFGTRPPEVMRAALRGEGWLHAYGSPDHPDAKRLKQALRDAYYPQEPDWKELVTARGLEVISFGLRGIAG